jgi:hypothetical protein
VRANSSAAALAVNINLLRMVSIPMNLVGSLQLDFTAIAIDFVDDRLGRPW